MKMSRFTGSQIIAILRQAKAGTRTAPRARHHGNLLQMARMKEFEEESLRLKKMVAEERLKAEIIAEAMQKNVVVPSRRREMVQKCCAG